MAQAWDPARMDMLLLLARRETSVGFTGAGDFVSDEAGRLTRRVANFVGVISFFVTSFFKEVLLVVFRGQNR